MKHWKCLPAVMAIAAYLSIWPFWPLIASWGSIQVGYIDTTDQKTIADRVEKLGQLGDSFGGLTALLSGVGLFFIIKTFQQQQNQIDQQKQQFDMAQKDAKDESKRQQTLLFYNLVSSPDVQQQLAEVEAWISKLRNPDANLRMGQPEPKRKGAAYVGKFAIGRQAEYLKQYYTLLTFSNLCIDAISLRENNLIDGPLFHRLLQDRLLRIVALFETVDFGTAKEDTSAERDVLNKQYLEPVKRLKELLLTNQATPSTEPQTPT